MSMIKIVKLTVLFSLLSSISFSQVGIGTITPNSSAVLDLTSTSKGFLPPRITAAQRNAISSPVAGLLIWCSDCGSAGEIQVYNGNNAWTNLIGETAAGAFICGTSTVTFTYNGARVTYGTISRTINGITKCWLDRNLGATRVATTANDPYGYGDLFQWGRVTDGHQLRSQTSRVGISGTINTQSTIDNPGHGNFIIGFSDWRTTQNNNLWQGYNGINNPCPNGFRVPTNDDFTAEMNTWGTSKASSAFNSTLKLPLSGFRGSDGNVNNSFGSNDAADYWTSTVSLTSSVYYANKFEFFGNSAYFYQEPNRALGCAIRCIKD